MAAVAHRPARKGYPYAVVRDGLTYVFETADEQAAFLGQARPPTDPEDLIRRIDELHASILKSTGGKGIPDEVIDEVLREVKEH